MAHCFLRCVGRSNNQARSTPWQWPQGRPLYVGGGARATGRCGPAGAAASGSLVTKLVAERLKSLLLLRHAQTKASPSGKAILIYLQKEDALTRMGEGAASGLDMLDMHVRRSSVRLELHTCTDGQRYTA